MPPKTTTPAAIKQAAQPSAKGKRVFTPRPPKSKEERLPKLYQGLTEQVENGHFQGAIKSCKTILRLDPSSLPAYQTLLFLHLQIDDYPAALELLTTPPTGAGELLFERAYCLYRLHRESEALEGLDKIASKGRKEQHLDAQIRYRLGEYEKAQQAYDELLAQCDASSSEHPDIVQNMSATNAHLDFLGHSYHSYLSDPSAAYTVSDADLETTVPSLPTGWAIGGPSTTKAAAAKVATPAALPKSAGKKRRHPLPKGASEAKKANEDPDRWLPLRQRASYINAQSKKKGANQSMGVGMTQGSSSHGQPATGGNGGGGGGGGGNKKKKGKK